MRALVCGWVLGGMVLAASPVGAQQRGNVNSRRPVAFRPAPPTSAVTPDGRTWERIQLRYIDARAVAAVLNGAAVVPTELDLWRQTVGMTGGFGGYGGMAGGYGAPGGGGVGGGFGAGPSIGGAYGVIADPNRNALIIGRGRNGTRGARFPNVPYIVDPNTNALIVDP